MLFFQQKNVFIFFISRSSCLSPFFSLIFADLSPTFFLSLSFSFAIFQICEHDNYTKLTTSIWTTQTQKLNDFRFPFSSLLRCLCFTRREWLSDFPQKYPRVAFGFAISHICWLSYFTFVCQWFLRTGGWVYGHVITKISRICGLPHFLRYEATLARAWSSAINLLIGNKRFMKLTRISKVRLNFRRVNFCAIN